MFIPIGVLFLVNSPEYQERYIKPYTLFPSAGKPIENDLFPEKNETKEEWKQRMQETASIRRRAKEIYDEMRASKTNGN